MEFPVFPSTVQGARCHLFALTGLDVCPDARLERLGLLVWELWDGVIYRLTLQTVQN